MSGVRRAVVQAVRAHDRRARCSCRCSSRSRSTRCCRRTGPTRRSRRTSGATRSRARSTASTCWFNRQADRYRGGVGVGARPSQDDDRARRGVVRRRHRAQVDARRLRLRRRTATAASSPSPSRRRRARASSTRASRPSRWRGMVRAHPEVALHLRHRRQRVGLGRRGRRLGLRAAHAAGRAQRQPAGARHASCAASSRRSAARRRTCSRRAVRAAAASRSSSSCSGPDASALAAARRSRRRRSCAACPARWTSGSRRKGQKPELDVDDQPRARRHARRERRRRSRRRCAPPSPASTPATGSIRRARRATCACGFRAALRESPADLAAIPIVLPGAGAAGGADGRPARPGRDDHARATGRRRSTTSIAAASITVGANIEGSHRQRVARRRRARSRRCSLPAGLRVRAGGQTEDQAEVFGSIFTALGVAVMLMYLILVMQFGIVPRSARDPARRCRCRSSASCSRCSSRATRSTSCRSSA